jgi:hypothetical protein
MRGNFARNLIAAVAVAVSVSAPPLAPASASAAPGVVTGVGDPLPTLQSTPFSDVSDFASEISWMARKGVTTGFPDGTFRPHAPVNRDAMAAFLYRLLDKPAYALPEVPAFADVPSGHQFALPINWLASTGVSTGWTEADGTRTFRPALPINRDAMAAFLYRLAGSPGWSAPAQSPFQDVETGHPFYREITWLAAQGITKGWAEADGVSFRPSSPIERAAMAAFVYRYAGIFRPVATAHDGMVAAASSGSVELSWPTVREPGVTGYAAYVATDPLGPWAQLPVSGTRAVAADLIDGTTYWFSYAVRSGTILSQPSAPISAVPRALPEAQTVPAPTTRTVRAGILAAGQAAGRDYLIVGPDVEIPSAGGFLVLPPDALVPNGLFAQVDQVQENADGTRTVAVSQAALSEVFSEVTFDMDGPLAQATPGGQRAPSTGPAKSDAQLAGPLLDFSHLTCKRAGLNINPMDAFESGFPVTFGLTMENMHGVNHFDAGNMLLGRAPSLILQIAGELTASIEVKAKVGSLSCEMDAGWARQHRLFHLVLGSIGGVPVTLDMEPTVKFEIAAAGKVSISQKRYFAYSYTKLDGSDATFERAGSADPVKVDITGELSADLYLAGTLSLMLGGGVGSANAKAGLYGSFGPNLHLANNVGGRMDCFGLDMELKGEFGLQLDLWVKRWRLELGSLTWQLGRLWASCLFGPPPGKKALVIGDYADSDDYAVAVLRGAGYDVTATGNVFPTDPLDLYSQVWYVSIQPLTEDQQATLVAYSRKGGSLFLTGERPCCEELNASVTGVVQRALGASDVTLGGLGDPFFDVGPLPVSSAVVDPGLLARPFTVETVQMDAPGGMSGVGSGNVLVVAPAEVPVAGAWVEGGHGRLVVFMDVNWLGQGSRGANAHQVAQNVALFLSRLDDPPGVLQQPPMLPAGAQGSPAQRSLDGTRSR